MADELLPKEEHVSRLAEMIRERQRQDPLELMMSYLYATTQELFAATPQELPAATSQEDN